MYIGSIVDYSMVTVILGLYIGQVAFRLNGTGRLTADSFSGKGTFVYQVVFAAINACLYALPHKMSSIFNTENVSVWAQATFMLAIPYLVLGYIMHYSLPKLSSRIISSPATLSEEQVKVTDEESIDTDTEKGTVHKDV